MRKFLTFALFLVAILSIFPAYTHFKVLASPVAPGVRLGGLELSAVKERDEIAQHLTRMYTTPLAVHFNDQRLVLEPDSVDFTVDVDQMLGEAAQYLEGSEFLDIAVREALGLTQQERDVPVRYLMDADKLRIWLEEMAVLYNTEPQPPRVLPPNERWVEGSDDEELPTGFVGETQRDWTWTPGASGYELNIEASIPVLIKALADPEQRRADLVLTETPAPRPTMDNLARALDSYTLEFPGFAAIYAQSFAENDAANPIAHVDADVSFSGMSTLKIGIVTAIMHKLDGMPADDLTSQQVGQWMDFALGDSNNYAANLLLSFLGDGSAAAGTRYFTDIMRQLGLESTYMQSAYDVESQLAQIPTPGNQREDWDTNPDTNLQSTPAEMGELLTAIYECTEDEGLLRATFREEITPDECETILFYMGHDEFEELLWGGLPQPDNAWILHKHGFAFESHSDVGLIWGPTGPYVLSVFLYRSGWMDWETSNNAMRDISRITWNFFELLADYDEVEAANPPEFSPPPAYTPLGEYVPAS